MAGEEKAETFEAEDRKWIAQTKAKVEQETAKGVAQALAVPNGIQLSSTFIIGSTANGNSMDLFISKGVESASASFQL
jgi:hypothetical protein